MAPKVTLKGAHHMVTVNVTQPVIERAEQRNSGHCMIADAIRAALPNAKSVYVDLATIRFTDSVKRQRYVYLTPQSAQQSLIHFDQGIHNEPFVFQLKKAVQVVESGSRTLPDGSRKRPSEAVQGVVATTGSRPGQRPIKLGGKLPERGAVGSAPSKGKAVAAAQGTPKTETAPTSATRVQRARQRASDLRATTKAVAGPDPAAEALNITMAPEGKGRIREFGLKQLRP